MHPEEQFSFDIVNNIKNIQLESAIRAMLYSPSDKNRDGFIRELLSSTLVLLMQETVTINRTEILKVDEEGYSYFPKDSNVPLVQFKNEQEELILPVFTCSANVHKIKGLEDYVGLAVPCLQVFEMADATKSSKIIFNPESSESLEMDHNFYETILNTLRNIGALEQDNSFAYSK